MKNLVIQVADNKYLIRYKVLKSVVSRKHTTKEGKIINRLEKHPIACEIYLYKINCSDLDWLDVLSISSRKHLNKDIKHGLITYLGRGLSKCSDKDRFNTWLGVYYAVMNLELTDIIKDKIASEFWHKAKLI